MHPALASEPVRPLTRRQYDRLVEAGVLEAHERVELLYGALVDMSPQGSANAEVVMRLNELFFSAASMHGARLLLNAPFAASETSQPEPDFAVVPRADYSGAHPTKALLVVEVADSSRHRDLVLKPALYAAAGVPEYWVVDLTARCVVVHLQPSGEQYGSVREHRPGEILRPAAFPDLEVPVERLLP